MVELNWVVLIWSCGNVDEIPSAPSNCPPPGCFKVDKGDVSFSSFFYNVWHKGPAFPGGKACHNEQLGLNVMLPLNVSLDLG